MLIGRMVLREVGRNFLASLVATTGMAFFMLSITFLKRTPGVGMGFLVEVFPLFFPLALQFTVPLALLTAVIMTFGRMAGDGELTSLKASGISPSRAIAPVLAGAAVVALCSLFLTDMLAPFAAARLRSAKRDLLQQIQTSFRAGLSDLDLGRGRISFERFQGNEFTDVCVEWELADAETHLWRAEKGTIAITDDDRVVLSLRRARTVMPYPSRHGKMDLSVGNITVEGSLSEITGTGGYPRRRNDLSAWELAYAGARGLAKLPGLRISSANAREELARRSALAASAFFFALIGIPLGVWSARGGRAGAFLMAVAPVLLVYFPIVIAASNLARSGQWPAYPSLWMGNLLLALLAWALMRKWVLR